MALRRCLLSPFSMGEWRLKNSTDNPKGRINSKSLGVRPSSYSSIVVTMVMVMMAMKGFEKGMEE